MHGTHEGRVAFVTGSGRGLGRDYALHLARIGCDIVVHDIDSDAPSQFGEAESLEQTVEEIKAMGRRASQSLPMSPRPIKSKGPWTRPSGAFGRIDYLINNAGGDIGKESPPRPKRWVFIQAQDVDWVVSHQLRARSTRVARWRPS